MMSQLAGATGWDSQRGSNSNPAPRANQAAAAVHEEQNDNFRVSDDDDVA